MQIICPPRGNMNHVIQIVQLRQLVIVHLKDLCHQPGMIYLICDYHHACPCGLVCDVHPPPCLIHRAHQQAGLLRPVDAVVVILHAR